MDFLKSLRDLLNGLSIPDSIESQINAELQELEKQWKRKSFAVERLQKDKGITEEFLNITIQELEKSNEQLKEYQQKELEEKEKKIKNQEAQLKDITDAMPFSLAYVDRNYCYQINNSRYNEWFGRTANNLKGKHIKSILGTDLFNNIVKSMIDRVFEGEIIQYELAYTNKEGKDVNCNITYTPAYNDEGENIGAYIFGEDITLLREQQKALALSKKTLTDLFDNVYEAILEWDNKGYITNYNKVAAKLLGIKEGEPFFIPSVIGSDDKERSKHFLKQLKEQGFVKNFRQRITKPDGSIYYVEISAVAKYDEKGKFIGSRDIIRDITEEIKVEQALKQSEAKYKSLVENNHFGIIQTDMNGIITYSSPRSNELTGFITDISPIGTSFANYIAPEDLPEVMKQFEKLITGKIPYDIFRRRIVRKDGSFLFVEGTSIILKDENNQPYGINAVYNDATEKVKAEQEIAQKNQELQKYIESNMQLENFARLASHDLREPLLNILAFSDLLKEEFESDISEQAHAYVDYIQESSKHMERLINDLLNYSTIGKYSNPKLTNLNDLMRDIVVDYSVVIKKKNAIISFDNLPIVKGHQTELRSLFQNLISNALKYQKPNIPPSITIGFNAEKDHWQFSVSDNGIGIASEHHEQIFVIYKRLNNRHQHERSTGIGLAHCKKVVELHGGKIWVTSVLGEGATVHFTISKHLKKFKKNPKELSSI
ncbi:MAG: PAS domain S-box protein [Chitinophagales bacterium]